MYQTIYELFAPVRPAGSDAVGKPAANGAVE